MISVTFVTYCSKCSQAFGIDRVNVAYNLTRFLRKLRKSGWSVSNKGGNYVTTCPECIAKAKSG